MAEKPEIAVEADPLSCSRPRYRQIFDTLRARISNGEYAPGQKLPTEADLMRLFDVSRTTVSRAMRDMELLGLITRRRGSGTYVCKPRETGERVDLALFVPWVESGSGLPYVEGLIHQRIADIASHGQATLLLQCLAPGAGPLEDRMINAARALVDNEVDAVLYYPAELPGELMKLNRTVVDLLVAAGIEIVLIDRDIVSYPERSEFTRIGYDNRRGGVLLTSHLINEGCKRIAFVGIPEVSTVVTNRLSGYYEAHRAHNMEVDPRLVHVADELDLTESFCRKLIEECQPDAIIGKMDRYAAIIGRHLMAMGLEIGRDIKLAGFDDEPIAELLPVPLTTIRLPVQAFAQTAYEAALRRIADHEADVGQLIVDTELIIRESTTRSS
ncbi:MAG: substrate-binding domain-containing protein [Planctomycetales bacterium]|nr:substrate-binding domain-containing protein [Planctomycetales bacterium]